jgi:8-oxo-dGTP pyrophosphatase MutT (NUDIX family)
VQDGTVAIKHATASTFVFGRPDGTGEWRLGLIRHPLFRRPMIPGGHVEPWETPPEAALREVREETGLEVRLLRAPGATVPDGLAASPRLVDVPWWIMEQPLDRDNHVFEPHFHVDHLYVAIAADAAKAATGLAHPFAWYGQAELAELDMFEDTRMFAHALFVGIDLLAAGLAAGLTAGLAGGR